MHLNLFEQLFSRFSTFLFIWWPCCSYSSYTCISGSTGNHWTLTLRMNITVPVRIPREGVKRSPQSAIFKVCLVWKHKNFGEEQLIPWTVTVVRESIIFNLQETTKKKVCMSMVPRELTFSQSRSHRYFANQFHHFNLIAQYLTETFCFIVRSTFDCTLEPIITSLRNQQFNAYYPALKMSKMNF